LGITGHDKAGIVPLVMYLTNRIKDENYGSFVLICAIFVIVPSYRWINYMFY